MKIFLPAAAFATLALSVLFSCSKINEATDLGDDLIPAVANVTTFDTTLDITAAYRPFYDSSKHLISENMALGRINDPVFGSTNADMYFNLSSTVYGNSPFQGTNIVVDSVVLSLGYQTAYGDTTSASQIGVQVSEIVDNNSFEDTVLYRFDNPGFSTSNLNTPTTFTIPQFRDSIRVGFRRDTVKVARVLRMRLSNSLGEKLRAFDTSNYRNDSLFREKFRGLAVKTTSASGNGALAYFNLSSAANTGLTVYYRSTIGTRTDSVNAATFVHSAYSQANSVRRTPSGAYLANVNNPNASSFYIQSSPAGSYVGIRIPALDAFPNKVIHRAELIAYKVPSSNPASDAIFTVPTRLLLDRKPPSGTSDSAYTFENDLEIGSDGSLNFAAFGGNLRSDNSYRFNITRYVQGIVTGVTRNDSLRLYAPLRSSLYAKNVRQFISIPNLDNIANGRVVLAGSALSRTDQTRMRLRIIYSNL